MDCEYMDIYAKQGTKVRFTAEGGYRLEKVQAKTILNLGSVYTVKETIVEEWNSVVILEEFPNKEFNTSLFCEVQ